MIRIPIRGGNWNNGANAGVFNLNLNNARSNANTNIGFRPALGSCQKLAAYGWRPSAQPKGSAIRGRVPKIAIGHGGRVAALKSRRAAHVMPQTYTALFPRVYEYANLYQAYLSARRGKKYRPAAMQFRRNLEGNLIEIQNELIWKSYRTGCYRFFRVFEPKERLVATLPFRDRVVQHALVRVIEPIWERRFISDSYACRPGKGMHAGADRAQDWLRGELRRHGRIYVLKGDVSKYFASIDHTILKGILRRHIACPDTLWLLDSIIDSTAASAEGDCGLPIGNLTSQLFANIYLHSLDVFAKQTLGEHYYLRYMDDFVVVGHDKVRLHEELREISEFLGGALRLHLNRKTQIFPVCSSGGRALDFLGFRISPTHRKLRKSSGLRMQRGIKRLAKLYRDGVISFERVRASVDSWLGHCGHCSSFRLRERILGSATFSRQSGADVCSGTFLNGPAAREWGS